jgi:hypothetical protein
LSLSSLYFLVGNNCLFNFPLKFEQWRARLKLRLELNTTIRFSDMRLTLTMLRWVKNQQLLDKLILVAGYRTTMTSA